ncbi:MAG: hypothetical protein U0326_17745 [Polyangiales bacterium]
MGLTRGVKAGDVLVLLALAGCGDPKRSDPFQPGPTTDVPVVVDTPAAVDNGPAGACRSNAQCDDGFACTDDECVIGGVCEHTAVTSRCAAGQRCIVGVGCATGMSCTTSAQCDDSVACTRDLCAAGGMCQNLNDDSRCTGGQVCTSAGCAAPGTCRTDADCNNRLFCDGVERCQSGTCAAGTPMDCRDSDPCTGDVCNEAMMRCDHPAVTPCGGMVTAGTYTLAPPISYSCGAGAIGPIGSVTLAVTATSVSVTGFATVLNGGAPTDGMFTATGTESRGGCTWRYTLSGSFTMPNRFSGSWNLTFDNCSASLSCFSRSGLVDGTRS